MPSVLAYSAPPFPAQLFLNLVFLAIVTIFLLSGSDISFRSPSLFLFWLSLDLQFVLSATSLFSFFKEKKKIFIVLYAVFPLVVSALELAV